MKFERLDSAEIENVMSAIKNDGDFHGYIPEKGFGFILDNYSHLAKIGVLERNWIQAYLHSNNFEATSLDKVQEIFDLCDKNILHEQYPIYEGDHFSNGERFSLFRGCAGPKHKNGMSWTSSLDKAIWYAAHHSQCHDLDNVAVYAAVVDREEIYCCGDHYDFDYITRPKKWWKIEIPENEFTLDRPR